MKNHKFLLLLSSAITALTLTSVPAFAAAASRGIETGAVTNRTSVGARRPLEAQIRNGMAVPLNAPTSVRQYFPGRGAVSSGTLPAAPGVVTSSATSTPKNIVGIEHRSAVANAVQQLLNVADRTGGIGQQIRTVAQAQSQNQSRLDTDVSSIQSRNNVVKFFIGPNFSAIKDAQNVLRQNQQQIQTLQQLQSQVTSTADQRQIQNQVNVLQQTNTQLGDYIQTQANSFSLFGWLAKLLAK
ncbi:MAG: hypothetical protein M1153_02665 [Patescibacteria group bacterium]|nr:hypothetical protein [Patescibacteria group bacterium]